MFVRRAACSVAGQIAIKYPSGANIRTFMTFGPRLRFRQFGSVIFIGWAVVGFRPRRLGSGAGNNLRAIDSNIGFGCSPDSQYTSPLDARNDMLCRFSSISGGK